LGGAALPHRGNVFKKTLRRNALGAGGKSFGDLGAPSNHSRAGGKGRGEPTPNTPHPPRPETGLILDNLETESKENGKNERTTREEKRVRNNREINFSCDLNRELRSQGREAREGDWDWMEVS